MLTRPMPHSVLIVSASERDTESIRGLLLESGFARTSVASDAATARERYGAEQHDIVIISSPVQGESGVRFACDITQMGYAGVLLLVALDACGPNGRPAGGVERAVLQPRQIRVEPHLPTQRVELHH